MKSFSLRETTNILTITDLMGLEEVNKVSFYSFNEKDMWFVLLAKYYKDKEILPELCSTFGIPYPEGMLDTVMPFQYDQDVLDELFQNKLIKGKVEKMTHRHYDITGKWFNRLKRNHFNGAETIKKTKDYQELPWELLIKNPLLKEDIYFSQIVKNIRENKSNYHHIAFIGLHLDLSNEQYEQLLKDIPYNFFYRELFEHAIEKGIDVAMKKYAAKENDEYSLKKRMHFLSPEYQFRAISNVNDDSKKLWLLQCSDVDADVKLKIMEGMI